GINNPFVFNVADVFIFVGAMGLIVFDKKPSGQKGS
ncbi:MAG: signal peptidase II, partial [Granulosicoccus sp.]